MFSPASPLSIAAGSSQAIQPQGGYYRVQWRRGDNQGFPSGLYQDGDALRIVNARPDHSGTYYCELYGADGRQVTVPYEIRVQGSDHGSSGTG